MQRALRFVVALIVGLGLITWAASSLVERATRAWFEKDVASRATVAVIGARRALAARWSATHPDRLREVLVELTQDDQIIAAAACDATSAPLAATRAFPTTVSCRDVGARMRKRGDHRNASWNTWTATLDDGRAHLSAVPVHVEGRVVGYAVLIHDLSFIEQRVTQTRRFSLAVFGFLSLVASALTIVAARWSFRDWIRELRAFLRHGVDHPKFRPIMSDVRDLVARVIEDQDSDRDARAWTPERLKHTLQRNLHGEKVVILSNREPYIHEIDPHTHAISVVHPASGLVTALEPVMRACSGTWVAHGSGSGDRLTVDKRDRIRVPPDEGSYQLRRVWLSEAEERGYYFGFSNEGLWPLCHLAHARPIFRGTDWHQYQRVNEKFANAVCQEVESDDPIILVQDYHFALAPRLIRQRLPRATIIMFWHIPWPNSQRLGMCPWRTEILEGMLGASILGFHTQFDCNNFIQSIEQFLEARTDTEQVAVVQHGRQTLVRPYPISLEWPSAWLRQVPSMAQCRKEVFAELGLRPDALLGVGVDRLDYTKGIEERLLAVERLLETSPRFRNRFTFVQLAAPSRTAIDRYRQVADQIKAVVDRVNQRFGNEGYRPIVLLCAHHEPPTVFRYYRAADLCYVSSLHDGMNLVAKEFVAAREDEQGVLVLSQFTGAARELTEALIVNPYDVDEASQALTTALDMSPAEQHARMRSMRTFVSEFNVYRWAGRMLIDAARLRRRERLSGRFAVRPREATAEAQ